jgi:hypothetical protein
MNPTKNKHYTLKGNAKWSCLPNSNPMTLREIQQKGFETVITDDVVPSVDTILSVAKEILCF